MKFLVTGARGFIGKNLVIALKRYTGSDVIEYDIDSSPSFLEDGLSCADVVYHLAGVNRTDRIEAFDEGNFEFTNRICSELMRLGRKPVFVLSSSIQADLNNPYGTSKRRAEETVFDFGRQTGAPVHVFRLPGVFGKWSRPNYNSVVATFCHNMARDLPIDISDSEKEIELVYIDDVVNTFVGLMDGRATAIDGKYYPVSPLYRISLGTLANTIAAFKASRVNLSLPDVSDALIRDLYATYISYLPTDSFAYSLPQWIDPRGELAELLKSPSFGQIFISRTRPGLVRGNHYHDTKVEKFIVLDGDAIIRFRHVLDGEVIEYPVCGRDFRVVDIPPGYTHSIENVGKNDLIVLFWAGEILNPENPDTFGMAV